MRDQDRIELEQLKWRQARLAADLAGVQKDLEKLEQRLNEPVPEPAGASAPMTELPAPVEIPPVISPIPHARPEPEPAFQQTVEPPSPAEEVVIPAAAQAAAATQSAGPAAPLKVRVVPPRVTPQPFIPPRASSIPSAAEPEEARSFEMRLGTYWFVRIGIVLVLTALAFFGNYAYQHYIVNFGAPAKVVLMYLASGLILATGAWLQRKSGRENLKNYAQVLFAGGLAAVYFTTYAAHHIDRLRVIESPVVDGVLLLAWAGFIVWLADRRKSEILALFAVGLAYYTSFMTRTGSFTLYSNVLLTAAAVFFLWRNRWAIVSFVSLPATYGAYGFWRFFVGEGWRFPTPAEGLFFSAIFLIAYWLLFTAAVFLSRHENFRDANRAMFLTFNNGAALGLYLLTMAQLQTGGLWKVLLVFGSALVVLSLLSRRWLADDPLIENAYLTQGLVLVTAGFIAKFSGMSLALMLAAESVILLQLGERLKNPVLRFGGFVSGLLATAWVLDDLNKSVPETIYLGMGVAIAMLANAYLEHRRQPDEAETMRGPVSFFTVLLLIALGSLTWSHADRGNLAHLFLVQAAVLTLSVHLLGVREIPYCSITFVGLGHLAWLANSLARAVPWDPWWQPALILALTLGLIHWWSRQRVMAAIEPIPLVMQSLCTMGVLTLLYTWTAPYFDPTERHLFVAALSGMTVLLTLYSAMTRSGALLAGAQLLLSPALMLFFAEVTRAQAPWPWLLTPGLALVAISSWEPRWAAHREIAGNLQEFMIRMATVYRALALGTLVLVVANYVAPQHRPWVYALLSLPLFVAGGMVRRQDLLVFDAVLLICGLVAYLLPIKDSIYAHPANLLLIAALLAQQRIARKMPGHYEVPPEAHPVLVVAGAACLWIFVSRYVQQHATGFLLTASWSVLALAMLAFGMLFRERTYRWFGLAMIATALGRIVLFDVWKLDTIYRILSFLALGVVLLVLGYIYNRFQERIRQWL